MANEQIIITEKDVGIEIQVQLLDSKKIPLIYEDLDSVEICIVLPSKEKLYEQAYLVDSVTGLWGFVLQEEHTTSTGLYFTYWSYVDDINNVTAQESLTYYVVAINGGE